MIKKTFFGTVYSASLAQKYQNVILKTVQKLNIQNQFRFLKKMLILKKLNKSTIYNIL